MKVMKSILMVLAMLFLCSTLFAQTYNVYYGDIHNHSNISDGTGTPDSAYRYARDTGKLDFFALADHCGAYTSTDWSNLKSLANSYNKDGSFVALWGFEWTSSRLGHVAVIGTDDMTSSGSYSTNTFPKLVSWVNSRTGVAFFNHPGRQDMNVEFSRFDTTPSDKFVGMELFNKSTAFSRYLFNDGYVSGDNLSFYEEANAKGWKIGAAGGGDNHTANWGTATNYRLAVLATSLSRASIMDAFRARRFYSTLDKNLKLSFQIDGREMGSTVSGGSKVVKIVASDANNETFTEVELFKNGLSFKKWNISTVGANISETISIASGDILYVVVTQGDRDQACSSPIWVQGGGSVDAKPSVSITSPANGAKFQENSTISISATASDDKGVSQVEFFNGSTSLYVDRTAPYSYDWNFVAAGSYTIKAVAKDTAGQTAESTVTVVVEKNGGSIDLPPSVSLTAPAAGSVYKVGDTVTLQANASDDVSVARVEFYAGATRVGSDSVAAYSATWKPTVVGTYDLKAVAFDSKGQSTTSAIVTVRVEDGGVVNPGTEWKAGVSYNVGDVVTYKGVTYVCKFAHVSNVAWYPGLPGLWFWQAQ